MHAHFHLSDTQVFNSYTSHTSDINIKIQAEKADQVAKTLLRKQAASLSL